MAKREQLVTPNEFGPAPYWLLWAPDITPADKLVYLALLDHLGNRDTAWPSQRTLAGETGLIRRGELSLQRLQQQAYLTRVMPGSRRSDE